MLRIPDTYFALEERDGFLVNERMKHYWAATLKVLDMVDELCRDYGLRYIATYGTLLGTARHQGFIPWDDDMDLAMPREDYNTFMGVAKRELPEYFKISSFYTTNGRHNTQFSCVMNRADIGVDEKITEMFYDCPFPAGMDIYPLDYLHRDPQQDGLRRELYNAVYDMAARFVELEKTDEFEGQLSQIEELTKVAIDRGQPIRPQLWGLLERLAMMFTAEESDEMMLVSADITARRHPSHKNEWLEDLIRVPFEMTEIVVPRAYMELVPKFYADWETPRKFASNHEYPFFKKYIPHLPHPEKYTVTGGEQ